MAVQPMYFEDLHAAKYICNMFQKKFWKLILSSTDFESNLKIFYPEMNFFLGRLTWSIKNNGGKRSKMSKNFDTFSWMAPPNKWITLLLANCIKSSRFGGALIRTLARTFRGWAAPTLTFSMFLSNFSPERQIKTHL